MTHAHNDTGPSEYFISGEPMSITLSMRRIILVMHALNLFSDARPIKHGAGFSQETSGEYEGDTSFPFERNL